ncbi:type I restriction enzyme endonuclease domain-containing protein [Leucothrix pacifica]|uniref:type I restriction enzyme endonuclease domain-containing protein n=1 Tax=Leucothrix pacifica TaxID=1247513 RepID=UPI001C641D39|nr:type I restriction enzyme endonuclease domain-containing protein [Leucothrix pacifica]
MDEDGLYDEITDEVFTLTSDLKNEMAAGDELDISFEEKAFYDILKTLAHKYNFEYAEEKLLTLSKAVKCWWMTRQSTRIGFSGTTLKPS